VNKRREVCLFPKLTGKKRLARELARALFDTHELWVKGTDWNQHQPGDDPLVKNLIDVWNVPIPRLILSHISLEGICSYTRYVVPRLDFNETRTHFPYPPTFITKQRPDNVQGTLTQKVSDTVFKVGVFANHGLSEGSIVDVSWDGGSRHGVTITAVIGNTVTFGGGAGFSIPAQNVTVMVIKNPATSGIYTYQWRHLQNPDEWGIGRVLSRMRHLGTARNWRPHTAQKISRTSQANQGSDQFPGEWVRNPDTFTFITPTERTPAVRLTKFYNMDTGASIRAIMRRIPEAQSAENPGWPETGRMMHFVLASTVVKALSIKGLSWPGIVYGKRNPDAFLLDQDEFWIPTADQTPNDFPYIHPLTNENYLNKTTSLPVSVGWMRDHLNVFSNEFTGGYGDIYYERINHIPQGFLIAKTSETSGTLKCNKHPVVSSGIVSLLSWKWKNSSGEDISGKRENVTVAPAGNDNLSISGGTGDPLPDTGVWLDLSGIPSSMLINQPTFSFSLSSTHNTLAINDRSVYRTKNNESPDHTNFPTIGNGSTGVTTSYYNYPGLHVPVSQSEKGSYVNQPGVPNSPNSSYITVYPDPHTLIPKWVNIDEVSPFIQNGLPRITNEVLYIPPQYLAQQTFGWTPSNVFEIISAGISPDPLQGNFVAGWENVLAYWEILSVQNFVFPEHIWDWLYRSAFIGASGSGYTHVTFNDPVFAKYGGKIMTWRGRKGNNTVYRYGEGLATEGVKTYQQESQTLFPGGIRLVTPANSVSFLMPTYQDVKETEERETEIMNTSYSVLEWSDSKFLQDLASIQPEAVPQNYVGNGLRDLQIGKIFGVSSTYTEHYVLFTSYDFSLNS
jgi:hypothetical protein